VWPLPAQPLSRRPQSGRSRFAHWCRCSDPTPNKGGSIRYASLSPKGGRYLYADVLVVKCGAADTFWTLFARADKKQKASDGFRQIRVIETITGNEIFQ
jgi:hypothetical protein